MEEVLVIGSALNPDGLCLVKAIHVRNVDSWGGAFKEAIYATPIGLASAKMLNGTLTATSHIPTTHKHLWLGSYGIRNSAEIEEAISNAEWILRDIRSVEVADMVSKYKGDVQWI